MKKIQSHRSKTKGSWGLLGAIIIPIVLVVCCVSHIALLVLGSSSILIGSFIPIEPYRSIIMALALAVLGFAFYKIRRKSKRSFCEKNDSCATTNPERRFKGIISLLAALFVTQLAFFFLTPEALADSRIEKKTETAQETSRVQYLACGACAMLFLQERRFKDSRLSIKIDDSSLLYFPY